jgi:hypothetical protein
VVDAPGPVVRSAGGGGVGDRSGGPRPGARHRRADRGRPVDHHDRAADIHRSVEQADDHADHDHRAARHRRRGGHHQRLRQSRTGLDDHQHPASLDHHDDHDDHDDPGRGLGHMDHRRIVYSKFQQRVWLIEDNGYITNTHLVSGRYDIPAFGEYHVYSKSYSTFATHNPSIIWNYMVRFAVGPQGGGIGLHEIPTQYGHPVQTVEQLGQPLSGGCLRQSHDDAVLVWNWAPVGTTVVVVP